jgi:hypothetical protein
MRITATCFAEPLSYTSSCWRVFLRECLLSQLPTIQDNAELSEILHDGELPWVLIDCRGTGSSSRLFVGSDWVVSEYSIYDNSAV